MRINLLPKSERPLPANVIRGEFVIIAVGLVLLTVTMGLALLERSHLQQQRMELVDRQQYRQLLERQQTRVAELRQDVESTSAILERMQKVIEDKGLQDAVTLLDEISRSLPERLFLERYDFQPNRSRLAGYALSLDSLTTFLRLLEQQVGVRPVVSELRDYPGPNPIILFEVEF